MVKDIFIVKPSTNGKINIYPLLIVSYSNLVNITINVVGIIDAISIRGNKRVIEILEKEISRYQRFQHPFSVAYFDCDNFKTVNDTLGHKTGDKLLTVVSETVRRCMRTMDVFARLGGDEFILLMPETGGENAVEAAERIQNEVNSEMKANRWPVTLSIGVSTFQGTILSSEEVIEQADNTMYAAKNSGKNRIIHHSYE